MYSFSGAETVQRVKSEFDFEVIDVFLKNTCSANSSKNNQNLWKTNDTTNTKENTSKFWNWWCFKILKYFFAKRIILRITYLEERTISFKMNY